MNAFVTVRRGSVQDCILKTSGEICFPEIKKLVFQHFKIVRTSMRSVSLIKIVIFTSFCDAANVRFGTYQKYLQLRARPGFGFFLPGQLEESCPKR